MTEPSKAKWRVELKVQAATWATFLLSLAASVFLASTATDYVTALPDWLEAIAYPALLAAGTFVAGYVKRSRPANLSPSTEEAVEVWLRTRAPRR